METKVLIVDDDLDILDSLTLVLETEGYTVRAIPKGEETMQQVAAFCPDIVLLDLLLSGKDGSEICRTLKQTKATATLPVIMMSAHPHAMQAVKAACADDFLEKPFTVDTLLSKMQQYRERY